MKKEWFSEWFNTPYYHILYKDRDDTEAQLFIDNLITRLEPKRDSKILDLACGKGRHAIYLNKKGYNVFGCDLSSESIKEANNSKTDTLHFFEHDMREPLDQKFDYIFNLFTSFGYFESQADNLKVLNEVEKALNDNGTLVIDFLNAYKTIAKLVPKESKTINGITFDITREVNNGIIVKSISFNDNSESYHFQERVQALTLDDFKALFSKTKLKIDFIYGDYNLQPFDPEHSNRLIILAKKFKN